MRRRIFKLGLACLFVTAAACLAVRFLAPDWLGYPTYASVETICPGDVNHDEQRDIRDVVAIQAHILGKKTLSGDLLIVADVNQDNQVDVLDIVRLVQHITRRKLLVDCKGTLHVTPASLNFGDVRVATSKDLTLAVSNGGNAKLTITAIASDNAQFAAVSPAVPFDVGPGVEGSVTIRYSPASVASHSGTLTVSGNSAGSAMSAVVTVAGAGLTAANPAPTLSGIAPNSATAGTGQLTVTAQGTNYVDGSVLQWDGTSRPTTFVSPTQLQAVISAADLVQEGVAVVRVVSPPPGGGASDVQLFTISRASNPPLQTPFVRYVAPRKGPTKTQFTLFGRGFSSTLANNQVKFFKPGSTITATLISANATTIVGRVPDGLAAGSYTVTVTVGGKATEGVQFDVTTGTAVLELRPASCFLLMPPGSAKEYLVVGGGTPPYKLKPLQASMQAFATVELKGTVIEVTGLSAGTYGVTDVTVEVEDSAAAPATDSTSIRIQNPKFAPDFDVVPHNLLPGSAPGLMFRVNTNYGDMRIASVRVKVEKAETNFNKISEKKLIALGTEDDTDFNIVQFTDMETPTKAGFEIMRRWEEGLEKIGTGSCEPGGIVLYDYPYPGPESVFSGGSESEFFVMDEFFQLPNSPGETFNITAIFTSVIPNEAGAAPYIVTKTKRFSTTSLVSGSPQISSIRPNRCEIGREVAIRGSGFSTTPAANAVTFTGPGATRLPAVVKSATADRLNVFVPVEAVNGVVRVEVNGKQSNGHEFWVIFHPQADCGLASIEGSSGRNLYYLLEQPSWEVPIGSATIVLDKGSIDTSKLVVGTQVGKVLQGQGSYGDLFVIVYTGQETSGARRYLFEIKTSVETSTVEAQLFLSANPGGAGVTLEMKGGPWSKEAGGQLYVGFDKPWYVPPAGTAMINFQMDVFSSDWMFYPNSPLFVRRLGEIAP